MVWASEIQNGVADNHRCVFKVLNEMSRQRIIVQLNDDPFADPLPELILGGPELLTVDAKHARGAFMFSGLGD